MQTKKRRKRESKSGRQVNEIHRIVATDLTCLILSVLIFSPLSSFFIAVFSLLQKKKGLSSNIDKDKDSEEEDDAITAKVKSEGDDDVSFSQGASGGRGLEEEEESSEEEDSSDDEYVRSVGHFCLCFKACFCCHSF